MTGVQTCALPICPGVTGSPLKNFAEEFFQEQVRKFPDRVENYLLLSDCYARNDKAIESELVLRDALKLSPDCALVYFHPLEAYLRGEKNDERITTFEKIYGLDKQIPLVLDFEIGKHIDNEEYDSAEEIIQRLDALMPGSENVFLQKLNLYTKKKQEDKIIELVGDAYERYPGNWNFAYLKALIASKTTRKVEDGIKIINAYLDRNYGQNALQILGDTYLQSSNIPQWEACYRKIFEIEPAASGIYTKLAGLYMKQQKYDKAEKIVKRCLEICPNSSIEWSLLGEVYRAKKDPGMARQAYREALQFNPTDYEAREALRGLEGRKSIFTNFTSTSIDSLVRNSPGAATYPNDAAVYLLKNTRRVVYERGASEKEEEFLIKVFNNRGIDAFKEYWIPYNSYAEKLIVEDAAVLKSDGSKIKADVDDGHVVFKSLEPNDIVHIKARIKNFYMGKLSRHFWDKEYFNGFYPIRSLRYEILVPDSTRFQHRSQHMAELQSSTHTEDGTLYQWSQSDQPAIESEAGMPPVDDVGKILYISSIANWQFLVDWYSDLARTKTRPSYEITQQVRKLFQGKENLSEEDKIRAIYNFITENIRYSSVAFRQSGFIPQKARDVLVTKIGDCKDMATLGIAMLGEAGIKAHYVLLQTKDQGGYREGLPAVLFNHCIAGVETEKGTRYLDLTAYNYAIGSIPEMDIDGCALPIKPETTAPEYFPRSSSVPGNIFRKLDAEVRFDKSITIRNQSRKTGVLAALMRDKYRQKGQTEQEKLFSQALSGDYQNMKLLKFRIENLDTLDSTVPYQFDFEVPNYLAESGRLTLLKIPWDDKLDPDEGLSYEKRTYPYNYWTLRDTVVEEATIRLPKGFKPINLPPKIALTSPIAEYSVTYGFSNGVLKGKREFIYKKSVISPDEYHEFKVFYDTAQKEDNRQILLRQK